MHEDKQQEEERRVDVRRVRLKAASRVFHEVSRELPRYQKRKVRPVRGEGSCRHASDPPALS